MAGPGLTAGQLLPRFLLPRLSWQPSSALANKQTIRALSSIAFDQTTSPRTTSYSVPRPCTQRCAIPRSRSTILQNPAYHRAFSATVRQSRDHHFDTLKFVQRLQEEGFTEAQAVAMMKVLSDVIEERLAPARLCDRQPL